MPPKAAPKPSAKPAAKPAAKTAAKAPAAKTAAKAPAKAAAPAAKASGNGVYIKGLGKESVADVKNVFGAAGNITNVRLRRFKYALVWFDSNAAASKAISSFNQKQVNGRSVTVTSAKAAAPADKRAGSVQVFVGPIFRQMTTKNQVKELFKPAGGKIARVRTYRMNYALVRFDSAATATKAVSTVNGTTFRNKKLAVKLCVA